MQRRRQHLKSRQKWRGHNTKKASQLVSEISMLKPERQPVSKQRRKFPQTTATDMGSHTNTRTSVTSRDAHPETNKNKTAPKRLRSRGRVCGRCPSPSLSVAIVVVSWSTSWSWSRSWLWSLSVTIVVRYHSTHVCVCLCVLWHATIRCKSDETTPTIQIPSLPTRKN